MAQGNQQETTLPGMEELSWRQWIITKVREYVDAGADRHAPSLVRRMSKEGPPLSHPVSAWLFAARKIAAEALNKEYGVGVPSGKQGDLTRTYIQPELITITQLVRFVRSQQALRDGIDTETVKRVEKALVAHPEWNLTVSQVLDMAEADDDPPERAAVSP